MSTISVVIGTYNRAAMVRQAILAALHQSRPPDEILVSDDASADATRAAVEDLASRYPSVRYFHREVNSGGMPNWNEAMARARGDFLALCCDDDRYLRDHLEASLAWLERHPETGLVHSSFIDTVETPASDFAEPRRLRSSSPLAVGRDRLLRYMVRYYDWPFHSSTIVMRREVWEAVGDFNPAYQLADTDWFVRAAERFQVVMLPRHGVYNRRHLGNWSNRVGSARMQKEIFEIVEGAITRLCERKPLRRALWKAVWRAHVRLRLFLTLVQRMKTGHRDAACASWRGMLQDTGRQCPGWIERIGTNAISRWCRGRELSTAGQGAKAARQSVSPL